MLEGLEERRVSVEGCGGVVWYHSACLQCVITFPVWGLIGEPLQMWSATRLLGYLELGPKVPAETLHGCRAATRCSRSGFGGDTCLSRNEREPSVLPAAGGETSLKMYQKNHSSEQSEQSVQLCYLIDEWVQTGSLLINLSALLVGVIEIFWQLKKWLMRKNKIGILDFFGNCRA